MKWNKVVAISLVFFMLIGVLPENVLANSQRPIQEIEKVTVSHQAATTSENELTIVPKVQMDWIAPLTNNPPGPNESDNTPDPTHYEFIFENVNDTSNTKSLEILASKFTENAGALSINAEEHFKSFFQNGALYEAKIIAKHKHTILQDGTYVEVDAPLSGEKIPTAHFITDFNLKAEASSGLTFSWEYIPGVSYYLYYEKGNKASIEEMTGAGEAISAEKAKGYLSEDGTRVVYTVDDAVAGQIYSAYILPTGINQGDINFAEVYYNDQSPKLIHVTPNIPLIVEPLGSSKIRLSWDITKASWVSVGNKLYQTVIWQIDETGKKTELGRIYNDNKGNQDVGYFECAAPTGIMTYLVDFILKDADDNLEVGFSAGSTEYTPDELREVPYQPNVPELFKYTTSDSVSESDITYQDKYKVKFDGVFDDLMLEPNNIKGFRENTFHYDIEDNEAKVQLVWDAPEIGTTGEVDYNLYYDIWVSDKSNSFDDTDKVVSNLKIEDGDSSNIIYRVDGTTVVGMKTTLEGLKTNRTYYIKIVAKRKYGENEYTISIPTIKQVSINKVGDVYEPPVIGKPPLQLKDVTQDSITIAWAEQWYEVMASQSKVSSYSDAVEKILAQWGHSRVYLSGDASLPLRFRDENKTFGDPIDLYGSTVQSKLQNIKPYLGNDYILNSVTMGSDTKYKLKVIKQSELDELIGNNYPEETDKLGKIERWILDIDTYEVESEWKDITDDIVDTTVDGVAGKRLLIKQDYNGKELVANTPYVVLISAYRKIDGQWRYCIIPSYILATTATDHVSDLETPKTPRLYNYESKDVRDTEVTVRWVYNASFDYELVYSRLNDPDSAEVWAFTEDDKKTFVDGGEAYVTISGLLPETTYNFWIKAKQKAELVGDGTPKESDWSTPVTCTTLTLANPLPPSGLGLASAQSILEAGKDYAPKGADYLAVEWMRNPSDLNNKDSRMTYSYVVEFADNPDFLDAIVATVGDNKDGNLDNNSGNNNQNADEENITYDILSKSLIRFDGLRANYPYYIRVKTVLNFKDGNKEITKESEFTSYIRLITGTSSDEYDGGENPNVIEYETPVVETFKNDIWTYEMVDAAKITTQILSNKEYNYTVTLKNYKGKYDALTRRLKMPVKIMDTLSNQGMNLQVVTNIGTYQIPGEALKSYLQQYAGADTLQIDLTRKSSTDIAAYIRPLPDNYVAGEDLQILFRSEGKSTKVNTLNKPMTVKLNSEAPGNYNYENLFTYSYNYAKGDWDTYQYQVDTENNKLLSFTTSYPGLNALYSRSIADSGASSSYIMNALSSNYNIMGLGNPYTESSKVMGSQYVTLMLGVARETQNINLTQGASEADYKAARAAGLYNGNRGNVTREEALAGVVKLYEIKHGNKLKASNMTFPGVSANYAQAVSKAYAAGLIESMTSPKANVTYAELCDWIALAIE